MPTAKAQIRQIIAGNGISSVVDVYTILQDSTVTKTKTCSMQKLDISV